MSDSSANNLIDALKSAQSQPIPGVSGSDIKKSFTQATGLVNYDLQRPAKLLYPVITPLRNMIPRRQGNGGTATNWKSVTGINTALISAGVSEGNRGGIITTGVISQVATYKGIGLEDNITFEADYAAQGFDDVKALAVEGLLRSLMIQEEAEIIGGNASNPLGTTPTPSLTGSTSGGSLATATYSVICVALTNDGYLRDSVSAGILAQVTRTNADGSTDTFGGGSAQKSANATVSITGPTGSIAATVTAVRGAVAYAWYWGTAGSEALGAITTINSNVITAAATGTQLASALPSQDSSTNALIFDGLISQISQTSPSPSNSYYATQATGTAGTGTPLTSNNAGGIVEIERALKSFWDNYKVSPEYILVNSQELMNITAKVIAAGGAPLVRFNMDAKYNSAGDGMLSAGTVIGTYLNKYTMNGGALVKIMLHPTVPPGTILFMSLKLPYPLSNVSSPLEVRTRRDYYQTEWPLKTRKYEYGVYADEVLVNYFPPAYGLITNIANG